MRYSIDCIQFVQQCAHRKRSRSRRQRPFQQKFIYQLQQLTKTSIVQYMYWLILQLLLLLAVSDLLCWITFWNHSRSGRVSANGLSEDGLGDYWSKFFILQTPFLPLNRYQSTDKSDEPLTTSVCHLFNQSINQSIGLLKNGSQVAK